MNIYLAARYDRRWEMLRVASALEDAGHQITSRWIQGGGRGDSAVVLAVEDLLDIRRADCLVSFTDDPTGDPAGAPLGGRHVELGVALAAGKRLCLVGPRENIFHHLPCVEAYDSVRKLLVGLDRA